MHKEFFETVSTFHNHRGSKGIREVTKIRMEQMARTCPVWMLRHVNRFLAANFPEPATKTR